MFLLLSLACAVSNPTATPSAPNPEPSAPSPDQAVAAMSADTGGPLIVFSPPPVGKTIYVAARAEVDDVSAYFGREAYFVEVVAHEAAGVRFRVAPVQHVCAETDTAGVLPDHGWVPIIDFLPEVQDSCHPTRDVVTAAAPDGTYTIEVGDYVRGLCGRHYTNHDLTIVLKWLPDAGRYQRQELRAVVDVREWYRDSLSTSRTTDLACDDGQFSCMPVVGHDNLGLRYPDFSITPAPNRDASQCE